MKKISELPNYKYYIIELKNAVDDNAYWTIVQIFESIKNELRNNKEQSNILKLELEEETELFRLACFLQFEPIIRVEFVKLIGCYSNIRKSTQRIDYYDQQEEIKDLVKLYNIAKEGNYNEGITYTINRLKELGFDSWKDLINENNSRKLK